MVEEAVAKAYRPALQTLAACEQLRFTLHLSGSLLEILERIAPDVLKLVESMVGEGRIELLGGAYHEPLLPLIPSDDRVSQILALRSRLNALFGVKPRGAWIAERFWEPSLPTDLHRAHVDYTLLDEHGFLQSGHDETSLCGHFLTEDQGFRVAVFPISKGLRYLIPFAEVEHVLGAFSSRSFSCPNSLWVFADSLEKFGAWPGTHETLFGKGWLKSFLEMTERNSSWLRTVTLGEALEKTDSRGMAYLPATSYPEMQRWSLPPHLRSDQGRCGNVRNFLVRYPEVNILHKRMLAASRAVHLLPSPPRDLQDLLWRSQDSCPYWHGWFGGAYLPCLRNNARAMASRAETLALKKAKQDLSFLETDDFDLCGGEELLISTPKQFLVVKPRGGGVSVWEDRGTGHDRVCYMNSWPEEGPISGFRGKPILPFEDILLAVGLSLDHLLSDNPPLLADLRGTTYSHRSIERENRLGVQLTARPFLAIPEGEAQIVIKKTLVVGHDRSSIDLEVELENASDRLLEFAYGMRLPLSGCYWGNPAPFSLGFPEVGLEDLDGKGVGEVSGIGEVRWGQPRGMTTVVRSQSPMTAWYFPLENHLMVEGTPAVISQGVLLVFIFQLRFEARGKVSLSFTIGDPAPGCETGSSAGREARKGTGLGRGAKGRRGVQVPKRAGEGRSHA